MGVQTDVFNATIVHQEDLTRELRVIQIRSDHGDVPKFTPGQFITIGLPKEGPDGPTAARRAGARPRLLRRAYSIASAATQRSYLELYLVLVADGRFTPRLWQLNPGEKVWMDDRAKGEFTLGTVPADQDLIMISTGTGLAPFMSMLRTHRNQNRWRRFVIIHGVRLAEDLGYRDELQSIASEDPSVIYLPTATREPEDSPWQGHRGRVLTLLDPVVYNKYVGTSLDPQHCHVFLCGNPDMIHDAQAQLESRGFVTQTRNQTGNIHFERYW